MGTKNSETNEPHRFRLSLADRLNLKNPDKNMALANLSIYYTLKTLSLHITTINFKKYLLQLGMMNLICLMDRIPLHISKTALNLSSRNSKL